MSAADRLFLDLCIELAEGGRFTCAPNPCVGCVIVRDGQVLGRGYHQRAGEGHAEVNALADAGHQVAGATVYVSLEPCAFVGRTPACAQTLVQAGVARVVIAALDPHPQVSGSGVQMLRDAGIEVAHIDRPEAHRLIRGYVSRIVRQRPYVRIKTASSLDGASALANGESQWITGPDARQDVQYWRARSDAIITGRGTVMADDPALTVRSPVYQQAKPPLRVVLDSNLQIPGDRQIFDGTAATLVVHTKMDQARATKAATDWLALPENPQGRIPLAALLTELASSGCNEVLVEAGAQLCGAFLEAGLWDEWICYVAPKWMGALTRGVADFNLSKLSDAPSGMVTGITQVGADIRIQIERQT